MLGIHGQEIEGWFSEFLRIAQSEYIKLVDPPQHDPFPGVKVIGRVFIDDDVSNALVAMGAAGVDEWMDRCGWFYENCLYVWGWEGSNEPQPMKDRGFRAALNAFTLEWAIRMKAAGFRTVGMNWGVGWPDVGHAVEMGPAIEACDYLGVHEYGAKEMWNEETWHCLRAIERTVPELVAAGFKVPPILVGECGIDGGVIDKAHAREGWSTPGYATEEQYVEQLMWYLARIRESGLVKAAFIFTVCSWDWDTFNLTESLAMKIAHAIAAGAPVVEPPVEPPVVEPPVVVEPPANGGGMKFLDKSGDEISEAAFREIFGDSPQVRPTPDAKYRVASLQDSGNNVGMDCQVKGPFSDGGFLDGEVVIIQNGGTFPGTKKEDGYFDVTLGACYVPPSLGGYSVYVLDTDGELISDLVSGLGWLCNTNHQHIQEVVFELYGAEEPPVVDPPVEPPVEPPPVEPPSDCGDAEDALLEAMALIQFALETMCCGDS